MRTLIERRIYLVSQMHQNNQDSESQQMAPSHRRPLFVPAMAILLAIMAAAVLIGGIILALRAEGDATNSIQSLLATLILTALAALLARGMWALKNWARTAVMLLLGMGLLYSFVTVLFDVSAKIFAGESVLPIKAIVQVVFDGLVRLVVMGTIPGVIAYVLAKLGPHFEESPAQRNFVDRSIRYLLIASALSAALIVFLIIGFTMAESWDAIEKIGLEKMLLGTIWRPGSIIGTQDAQFGLVPMIVGSVLSTFGAILVGVPISLGTAILLAEIAPPFVREIVRPAVELLAGIPSVVYGLFGMVVLAPLIRRIPVP